MGVNKVILVGQVVGAPEIRENAVTVCTFDVGTAARGQQALIRHRIVAFEKLAEKCKRILRRGSKVYVEGSSYPHSYKDKQGELRFAHEVRAKRVFSVSDDTEFQDPGED